MLTYNSQSLTQVLSITQVLSKTPSVHQDRLWNLSETEFTSFFFLMFSAHNVRNDPLVVVAHEHKNNA